MNIYHFLLPLALTAACQTAHAQYSDPASTYVGMELLDPDPENLPLCHELPLQENFSDETHYDGTSVLPIGWLSTGTDVWQTANTGDLPALSGIWYMIAPEGLSQRDERAYTPFFNLQQGVTYTLSFGAHQEATTFNGETNITTIRVKVGTQQDADFLPVTIGSVCRNNRPGQWDVYSFDFCPAVSGAYTFCFELEGVPLSGVAAIDDVRITSPINRPKVKAQFHPFGIFDANSGNLLATADPVLMTQYVEEGDATAWTARHTDSDTDCPTTLEESGHGYVVFSAPGDHEITLSAANENSTDAITKHINVQYLNEPVDFAYICSYDPCTSGILGHDEIPAYSSDPNGLDFVSGPTNYYSSIAEYFPAPWNGEITITDIDFFVSNLRYCATQSVKDDQSALPFKVKIYGADGAGRLDSKALLGSSTYTMRQAFGTDLGGFSGHAASLKLQRPVSVVGPFYIVFEYSEKLITVPQDPNVGRSYASMSMVQHIHPRTTLYCKPYALPPFCSAELDEWCPVSDINSTLAGMGLNIQLKASFKPAVNPNGLSTPSFISQAACRLAGSSLIVDNPDDAATLSLYSSTGVLVLSHHAPQGTSTVDVSALPAGIYIATIGDYSCRLIKK